MPLLAKPSAHFQADFACPGIFGTYPVFSRQYEKPILKARSQNCSSADAELGRERSEEVSWRIDITTDIAAVYSFQRVCHSSHG